GGERRDRRQPGRERLPGGGHGAPLDPVSGRDRRAWRPDRGLGGDGRQQDRPRRARRTIDPGQAGRGRRRRSDRNGGGAGGSRLCLLSERRAKPAVPFGGKYRIIDFTLSNCVNSGIFDVGVLTQYRPTSLNRHIGSGRPWDLDRTRGGIQILQPSLGAVNSDWYQGTADAIYRNLVHLRRRRVEHVLVLSGDHVYTMDYNVLYEFHAARRARVTVAVTEVPEGMTSQFGILTTDSAGRVVGFEEKPRHTRSRLA